MKLNNKGYLIVEVILAGVLTFTMAYFLINLTLKIRNRADDVNVETVMLNDKTVITNEIMSDVIGNNINNVEHITNGIKINFVDGSSKDLTIVDNTITYGTYTKKFSENAIVGEVSIRKSGNYFLVEIPITTKYSNKDFGINIVGFTKEALAPLTCSLSANSSKIIASFDGDMIYYGWNESYKGSNSNDMDIAEGTYTYYMKDAFGNTGNCSISIVNNAVSCDAGYTLNSTGDICYRSYQASPSYIANGHCSCLRADGLTAEAGCKMSGGNAVCSCPSGASIITNGCSKTITSYFCNTGDEQIGYSCNNYRDVINTCPSGYTKINNTYCSK